MVSALVSRSCSLGLRHCVVFLGKTLCSHSTSFHLTNLTPISYALLFMYMYMYWKCTVDVSLS